MLEKLFALSERNTTVKGEIIAGLTTFITMAYILFLAPNLLSIAGMDKDAVLIATALGGGIVTIAMGLLVNYPICLAPGVGLLAFYTFTVVLGMGVAWQTALGAVFISGIVFLILTLTTVRQHIVEGIPASMKIAITVGIGLFITIIAVPDFSKAAFFQLDIGSAMSMGLVTIIFSFTFVELFDSMGTLIGTATKAGIANPKEGKFPGLGKAMTVDAVGVSFGALLGASTITAFVESAAGVGAGGRTGLTAVTCGILFLLALLFAPLITLVPNCATAPILILVGALMMEPIRDIDFSDWTEAFPAFMVIALMPFTYSIANGVSAGLIMYPLLKIVAGRTKEVHWIMYPLAIIVLIRYIWY